MKLSCGWLPPADPIEAAFMVLSVGTLLYGELAVTPPHTLLGDGLVTPPLLLALHCGTCECAGICAVVRVTVSAPPAWPCAKPVPT
jgi:hypothetical protein